MVNHLASVSIDILRIHRNFVKYAVWVHLTHRQFWYGEYMLSVRNLMREVHEMSRKMKAVQKYGFGRILTSTECEPILHWVQCKRKYLNVRILTLTVNSPFYVVHRTVSCTYGEFQFLIDFAGRETLPVHGELRLLWLYERHREYALRIIMAVHWVNGKTASERRHIGLILNTHCEPNLILIGMNLFIKWPLMFN